MPLEPATAAESVLAPLAEINELALELMAQQAAGEPAGLPTILREPVELWRALTPPQRRRIAGCPFLLVDIGLGDAGARPRSALEGVRDSAAGERWFAEESLPRLAYLTLTYAWHLARTRRLAARVVLGLPDERSDWLASLSLRQLGECMERSPGALRPRWPANPQVWRYLLEASASADPGAFEPARLHGIQLLAAEFLQAEARRVPGAR